MSRSIGSKMYSSIRMSGYRDWMEQRMGGRWGKEGNNERWEERNRRKEIGKYK